MKIDITQITDWKIASKTRPVKAKPLISLLVDRTVTSKFLVDTIEGREPLGDGVVICVGEAGDTWQQMPKKLLAKYKVVAIDADGWMVCEPLPDNAVNCIEMSVSIKFMEYCSPGGDEPDNKRGIFYINGQWGETVPGLGSNIQWGNVGDFLCQNRTDPTDVWIVRRKLFLNTYVIKS